MKYSINLVYDIYAIRLVHTICVCVYVYVFILGYLMYEVDVYIVYVEYMLISYKPEMYVSYPRGYCNYDPINS